MGFLDSISSALGASALGPIGAIGGALVSGASSLLGGQNANAANNRQFWNQTAVNQAFLNEQQQYNTNAATIAFDRSQQAATDAYNRNNQNLQEMERFDLQTQANQQAYNTGMANTAYQRSVADMKAAGLNPILGVASGGAASPPISAPTVSASGAPMASSQASSSGGASVSQAHMQDAISPAIASAFQGAKLAGALNEQQISNDNLSKTGEILDNQKNKSYWDAIAARYGVQLVDNQAQAAKATALNTAASTAETNQRVSKRDKFGSGSWGQSAETADAVGKTSGLTDALNSTLDLPTHTTNGPYKFVSPNFSVQQIVK